MFRLRRLVISVFGLRRGASQKTMPSQGCRRSHCLLPPHRLHSVVPAESRPSPLVHDFSVPCLLFSCVLPASRLRMVLVVVRRIGVISKRCLGGVCLYIEYVLFFSVLALFLLLA